MVKIYTNQNGQLFKVTCLSTDDKPIGVVPANTICEELDTGDKYFYDPVASQWAAYPGGSGSGSGLPDPSTLTDGTAMVAVNGEWKMQEGYGYTDAPAFEPITWDGETEGREIVQEAFCKVSDESIQSSELNGSKIKVYEDGETAELNFVSTQSFSDDIYIALYGDSMQVLVALNDTELEGIELHKGVYFMFAEGDGYTQYISELAAAPSVHKFDSALIPTSGGAYTVTFSSDDGENFTCDKALNEIVSHADNVKFVFNRDGFAVHSIGEIVMPSAPLVYAHFLIIADNELQNFTVTYNNSGVSGTSASYTLTPAT